MPDGRVLIAFDDAALEPAPTWTRIDHDDNLVAGIDIRRGRQTEFDQTEASTAAVYINDREGLFDPDNTSSPYFGELDGKQIMLQVFNPVTEAWVTQYRGHIDDYGWTHRESQVVSDVQIDCTDLFDYLAGVKVIPGLFGDPPPAGSEGTVFYEDADWQTRIKQMLTDAALDEAFFSVFTGNVELQEAKYDPDDPILVAIRDAVDGEFPGIANLYTNKLGQVCAHGRLARFNPETTAFGTDWNFTRWKAGDGAAILLDSERAQIRPPLTWSRSRSRIINAAIAYPRFPLRGTGGGTFAEPDIPDQINVDATSRDAFGYRSWEARDLLTLRGTTTGLDAKAETKLFADYYVANYKDPRTRVEALTFKAINPLDRKAASTWALLCGVDISDVVNLKHGYPGGVGMDGEDFYVEGSEMQIRPGNPVHDLVELTLNVSPAAYYGTNVFS